MKLPQQSFALGFAPPILFVALFVALLAGSLSAATVTLRPSKDTTIYGSGDANLSNGAGRYLFAGSSGPSVGGNRVLRSLLAFDLAGQVPAGSTINTVTLTFAIDTPLQSNANTVRVHRVLADWGEGTSVGAGVGEGIGAAATNGDATWNHRFFSASTWTTPGGDFSATVSASLPVAGRPGNAVFTGAALVADVQAWASNPAANFGWLLRAQDEAGPALRFSSRQGPIAPTLLIDFTAGTGGGNTAPAITTQPSGQTVVAGATATFTVAASGTPAPTYQWRKDGVAISGATNATLTLSSVTAANAGSYTVVVTNTAGSVPSAAATLTVNAPPIGGDNGTARLSNLSVRAAMAADQRLIVGFFVDGGSRSILVRAGGPALTALGLGGAMTDPRLELFSGSTLLLSNDNWAAALADVFTSVGAFGFPAGSRDAAFQQSVTGSASVHALGTGAGIVLVEAYDTGAGNTPRMTNLSARNRVGTGDEILIAGFAISGIGNKRLLIRAAGPALAALGVSGVLANPKLEIFSSANAKLTENDDWAANLAATFTSVGAFGFTPGSRDSALIVTLAAGSTYTVQVSGADGGTGEALVEIYELP